MILLLGAAAALAPAIASSETPPKVEAVQTGSEGVYPIFAWSPTQATIETGGAVRFSTGSTNELHGLVWLSGPGKPTCDSAVPVGEESFGKNWSGSCSFGEAGTYRFRCSYHEYMKGTIVVNAVSTTTTETTSTPPSTPTTTAGPPPPGAPLGTVVLPAVQRGRSVHGSASIGEAGSRLEVDLLATRGALTKTRRRGSLRVGRLVMFSVGPGRVVFSVRLTSLRASRALNRRGRLALKVQIKVTPPGGTAASVVRGLKLKQG